MAAAKMFVPPGGHLEVVFSFDTTGSMYTWLDQLRGRIQYLMQRLQADIPGIKMAVFAHGDYCDAAVYVTKWIDFTCDIVKLCTFVNNVEGTGGGDAPECYELVLKQVGTELSWTPGSRRVLVMIGDDKPHNVTDPCNKEKIDWRTEVQNLAEKGVTIYGVQCWKNKQADKFYETISSSTGGKHLRVEDFSSLFDTLMAVCYREDNTAMLANYEQEVRARSANGRVGADIDAVFAHLRNDDAETVHPFITKPVTSVKLSGKPIKIKKLDDVKRSTRKIKLDDMKRSTSKIKCKLACCTIKRERKLKSLDKFKNSNLPLLKRENVPESNFLLHSLHWYPWKLSMVDDVPNDSELWRKRASRPGYSLKMLSLPKSSLARSHGKGALFEVAVQIGGEHTKRYVMFNAFSSLCFGVKDWEQKLLGVARSQVDIVLNSGCRVYIRFCFLDSNTLLESLKRNLKRYDYAWSKVKAARACPRDVVKGNVVISKS